MASFDEKHFDEKIIKAKSGWLSLVVMLLAIVITIVGIAVPVSILDAESPLNFIPVLVGFVGLIVVIILASGLRVVNPNEAVVLVLFGKYVGTIATDGFFFVNPFTVKRKVSLKARTLVNDKQKVNDERGNPIEIGVVVIWRVADTAKALFKVEDYFEYITTQTDSAIRNVARQYPYDITEDAPDNEKSLRGSSQEIAAVLKDELLVRVEMAGIEIIEARISHLAYAQEIASAMLQRQQAEAIVAARQKIVDGAVGMVEMALNKLNDNNIVKLDDDRKAIMVSNLLVVLCGSKDAQPIVNTGL